MAAEQGPSFNPWENKKDRMYFNNRLGYHLLFFLQSKHKIMPTHLVASIVLLYRKGISEETLLKKITWLGIACRQRGVLLSDSGLPDSTTLKIGLKHLD